MQEITFQSPVYASPAFASVRLQSVKAAVQAIPQCQFGGGKVPVKQTFTLLQKIKNVWKQIKFALHNIDSKFNDNFRTGQHELGHMLAMYSSGQRPLGISLNIIPHKNYGAHILREKKSLEFKDIAKNIWVNSAGHVFNTANGLEETLAGLYGSNIDFVISHQQLKKLGVSSKVADNFIEVRNKMKALPDGDLLNKYIDTEYKTALRNLLKEPVYAVPIKYLERLKKTTETSLMTLCLKIQEKNGWMFGKTFRTQLYEKVFTAAERQQFEKIYQEFEREFLALPEIQALKAKP